MSKKDKNNILMAIYFTAFLALVVTFYKFGSFINPLWIGVIFLVVQQFYVLPRVHKLYLEMHEMESKWWVRYIPIWNEADMFTPVYSILTASLGVLSLLFVVVGLLPAMDIDFFTPMIAGIFGNDFAFDYSFYFILIGIIVYAIQNVVRGFAYVEMTREINRKHAKYFGDMVQSWLEGSFVGLRYLMFFAPVGRTISLLYLSGFLSKMLELTDIRKIKVNQFVEEGA